MSDNNARLHEKKAIADFFKIGKGNLYGCVVFIHRMDLFI